MDGLESVEDNVIKMTDVSFEPNPNGIGYELFYRMKDHGKLLAQIDTHSEEKDNYDELLVRCIRTAIHLKKRQITPGSIICVCSYNHLNSCVPYLAGLFIGTIVCCLDPLLSFRDSVQLLLQIKPKIIFVVVEKKEMYMKILNENTFETQLIVFGKEGSSSFEAFLEEAVDEDNFVPEKVSNVNDIAAIVFTSGTTGLAKGVCLSHHVLQAKGEILSSFFNIDRCFLTASLYWIYGVLMLINGIVAGATRILTRSLLTFDTWRNLARFKATLAFVSSHRAIAMVKDGKPDYLDANSLRHLENFVISGSRMPSHHLVALREILPNVNVAQLYGQTELGGFAILFRPRLETDAILLGRNPKSCGRPLPGFWYKITCLNTERTLGCNEIGELRLKTKIHANGYYTPVSSETWDSDNWFKTGDFCFYDEDYCFYVVDKVKEMIHFQSQYISSSALEMILLKHHAVKEAAVIGVPDQKDGEHPLGVIVLQDKELNVTEEVLLEYVNERVSEVQKIRAGIRFVEDVPYTPTGKIRKALLKENILK